MDEAGIELTASDPAEPRSLGDWPRTVPGLRVARGSGAPAAGEQGALDYLELLAGSSVLVAAVRMIPEFLRARRGTAWSGCASSSPASCAAGRPGGSRSSPTSEDPTTCTTS